MPLKRSKPTGDQHDNYITFGIRMNGWAFLLLCFLFSVSSLIVTNLNYLKMLKHAHLLHSPAPFQFFFKLCKFNSFFYCASSVDVQISNKSKKDLHYQSKYLRWTGRNYGPGVLRYQTGELLKIQFPSFGGQLLANKKLGWFCFNLCTQLFCKNIIIIV